MGPSIIILRLMMSDIDTAIKTAEIIEIKFCRKMTADKAQVVTEMSPDLMDIISVDVCTSVQNIARMVQELEDEGLLK